MRTNIAKRHCQQFIAISVLLLTIGSQPDGSVVAQSTLIMWSPPLNLSDTLPSSAHADIIADQLGYVHVFWSEDIGGPAFAMNGNAAVGNTLMYRRWDGLSWTPSVDILFVPGDFVAEFVAATVDAANTLHVVWTGLTNIYYSSAPAAHAGSAHAWSTPIVITPASARSSWESSVAASGDGNLYIAYATRGSGAGIYVVRSADGGSTWSDPIGIAAPLDALETTFSNVKAITDASGRVHVVWQTSEASGFGQGVYYARSNTQGRTWSPPNQFGYRGPDDFNVGLPYIMATSESEIHVVYTGGSTAGSLGRYERISLDAGETWSAPRHIIPEMIGINGYVIPIVDGARQLHLIVNMRPVETQEVGIYYSRWLGDRWSGVIPIYNEGPASSAHYTAAAVRLGNELHLVWTELHAGEIWYLRGQIPGVTATLAQVLPTPPGTSTVAPQMQPSTVAPTIRPVPDLNRFTPATTPMSDTGPFLLGVGAAIVLIAIVIVHVLRRTSA